MSAGQDLTSGMDGTGGTPTRTGVTGGSSG